MDVFPGRIVYSNAGRDKGRMFIVTGFADEARVKVSDGDVRRLEKPKLKKIKHLNITGDIANEIAEKLKNKQKVTNSEIRNALADYKSKVENEWNE